jgi:hypothetical protein
MRGYNGDMVSALGLHVGCFLVLSFAENKVDQITDEEVANELKEGIFAWRG